LLIVAPLLKSGLEIVIINENTPLLIVDRFDSWLRVAQTYLYLDQDIFLRFVLQYQAHISLIYGGVILYLSSMVALNLKEHIFPLVSLILASVLFFYVDLRQGTVQPLPLAQLQDLFTLVFILASLFMIKGENIFEPLVNVPVPA
jgi:hypothetical protein